MGTHSGKFLVRLDPALHKQLSHEAEDCHVSLNEICIRKLAAPVFISTFASPFSYCTTALLCCQLKNGD